MDGKIVIKISTGGNVEISHEGGTFEEFKGDDIPISGKLLKEQPSFTIIRTETKKCVWVYDPVRRTWYRV